MIWCYLLNSEAKHISKLMSLEVTSACGHKAPKINNRSLGFAVHSINMFVNLSAKHFLSLIKNVILSL